MRSGETLSLKVVCRVKIPGEILDNVCSETHTSIQIQHSPPLSSVITISEAPFASVQKALLLLFERMHLLQGSPPSGECCLLVPPSKQLGLLIGKAGSSLKAIQRDTRASIWAHKPHSGDQLIQISGDPSAVTTRLQPPQPSEPNVEGAARRVSFRLLCSYDTAGGVIGKK